MIPELGHITLIAYLVLCLVGGILPLAAIFFNNAALEMPIKRVTSLLFFLITSSFLILIYSFLVDDFSVAYVAQNSNINLPFYFKFAATWGAHEGSLILWILAMNAWLIGFIFLTKCKNTYFHKTSVPFFLL